MNCAKCGNDLGLSRVAISGKIYCSAKCAGRKPPTLMLDDPSVEPIPKPHHIWLKCEFCGDSFRRCISSLRGKHHFCSKSCAMKGLIKRGGLHD